jgi:hypothetical protein
MPGKMSEMPRLPVWVNENLASYLLPDPTMVSSSSSCHWLTLFYHKPLWSSAFYLVILSSSMNFLKVENAQFCVVLDLVNQLTKLPFSLKARVLGKNQLKQEPRGWWVTAKQVTDVSDTETSSVVWWISEDKYCFSIFARWR